MPRYVPNPQYLRYISRWLTQKRSRWVLSKYLNFTWNLIISATYVGRPCHWREKMVQLNYKISKTMLQVNNERYYKSKTTFKSYTYRISELSRYTSVCNFLQQIVWKLLWELCGGHCSNAFKTCLDINVIN